jgi:hypothetical protein
MRRSRRQLYAKKPPKLGKPSTVGWLLEYPGGLVLTPDKFLQFVTKRGYSPVPRAWLEYTSEFTEAPTVFNQDYLHTSGEYRLRYSRYDKYGRPPAAFVTFLIKLPRSDYWKQATCGGYRVLQSWAQLVVLHELIREARKQKGAPNAYLFQSLDRYL